MLLGAKIIMAAAVGAALVTFAARTGRRENCPNFSGWWKTEGRPIFIGVWLAFVAFVYCICVSAFRLIARRVFCIVSLSGDICSTSSDKIKGAAAIQHPSYMCP